MTEKEFQTLAKPLYDDLGELFNALAGEIAEIIREGGTPDQIDKKIANMLGEE